MRCSKCDSENREGRKFCANCGAPLSFICPKCGVSNQAGEKFCGECGGALTRGAEPTVTQSVPARRDEFTIRASSKPTNAQSEASADLDGERKTVTALFADIKGSMELMEDLDPEDARKIVDPALKLMIDTVHHYDGYIVQSTGDGIFALFGAPAAHEDHPQRSLYAALRLQEELKRYSDGLRVQGKQPLQARVG
jgi:class 3 adenylate cyclase